jgi:hypothetical protein
MRTDGPTTALPTPRVFIVDRRAQYQAKVLNAGLNNTIDFRSRHARGLAFKARTGLLCPRGVDNALARVLSSLDWTPATLRPDAPPSQPGSAAA